MANNRLVAPDGTPLIQEPRLVVLKVTKTAGPIPRELRQQLSQATGCPIAVIPMDSDILMGRMAAEEMQVCHKGCHKFLDLPQIDFNIAELKVAYEGIKYLCEKTAPADGSVQIGVMKKVKKAIEEYEA